MAALMPFSSSPLSAIPTPPSSLPFLISSQLSAISSNAGYPADQAAEHDSEASDGEAEPEGDNENDEAIVAEDYSSDGGDDGEDLIGFVGQFSSSPPDAPSSDDSAHFTDASDEDADLGNDEVNAAAGNVVGEAEVAGNANDNDVDGPNVDPADEQYLAEAYPEGEWGYADSDADDEDESEPEGEHDEDDEDNPNENDNDEDHEGGTGEHDGAGTGGNNNGDGGDRYDGNQEDEGEGAFDGEDNAGKDVQSLHDGGEPMADANEANPVEEDDHLDEYQHAYWGADDELQALLDNHDTREVIQHHHTHLDVDPPSSQISLVYLGVDNPPPATPTDMAQALHRDLARYGFAMSGHKRAGEEDLANLAPKRARRTMKAVVVCEWIHDDEDVVQKDPLFHDELPTELGPNRYQARLLRLHGGAMMTQVLVKVPLMPPTWTWTHDTPLQGYINPPACAGCANDEMIRVPRP
ncbi:hypothetical protein CF319_g7948 [Tilletia indica]|uniref:Uncharacterized protein n=1 Tax=Tilletia indica TaxID=43049 RepID=A0A177TXQ0_9BASI|nr:hypothetical protein CF319_g7948 [Tilletia indica]KAE8244824.1 hypothetical protein A4X13_0g6231 [Tilletia indica]